MVFNQNAMQAVPARQPLPPQMILHDSPHSSSQVRINGQQDISWEILFLEF